MGNASMLEISTGEVRAIRFFIPVLYLVVFAILLAQDVDVEELGVAPILLLMGTIIALVASYNMLYSVCESADGLFLRVKINWTEKTLPLSAIQSIEPFTPGGIRLRVTVAHPSSANSFSPGATFSFVPNEAYFKSALFRQFPPPDDFKKHLEDNRRLFWKSFITMMVGVVLMVLIQYFIRQS